MARDLGVKHQCFNCETKFYDLHKPFPVCPKCGADQRDNTGKAPASASSDKRRPKAVKAAKVERAAPAEEAEGADDDSEDEDDEEDEDDDEG